LSAIRICTRDFDQNPTVEFALRELEARSGSDRHHLRKFCFSEPSESLEISYVGWSLVSRFFFFVFENLRGNGLYVYAIAMNPYSHSYGSGNRDRVLTMLNLEFYRLLFSSFPPPAVCILQRQGSETSIGRSLDDVHKSKIKVQLDIPSKNVPLLFSEPPTRLVRADLRIANR